MINFTQTGIFKKTAISATLLSCSILSLQAQAQTWPQSEEAYLTSQQSPQWIENKAPSATQAPQNRPSQAPQHYQQPNQNRPYYPAPMNGYGYSPQNVPQAWQSMPPRQPYSQIQPGYAPQAPYNPWNNHGGSMPFMGNNQNFNPWNGGGFPNMNNMNMPNMNMPNMNLNDMMPSMPEMGEMPSPSFSFPTMNMPFWN